MSYPRQDGEKEKGQIKYNLYKEKLTNATNVDQIRSVKQCAEYCTKLSHKQFLEISDLAIKQRGKILKCG